MQSPMSENQNLTKFLPSALPGKEAQVLQWVLASSAQVTGPAPAFPLVHIGKWPCFHRLASAQYHFLFLLTLVYKNLLPVQLFKIPFYLLDWMLPES